MGGEQLREIDGEPGMHANGNEAEQWQKQKELVVGFRQVTGDRDDQKGCEQHPGEGALATKSYAEGAEGQQAEPSAGGLDKTVSELGLLTDLGRGDSVALQDVA